MDKPELDLPVKAPQFIDPNPLVREILFLNTRLHQMSTVMLTVFCEVNTLSIFQPSIFTWLVSGNQSSNKKLSIFFLPQKKSKKQVLQFFTLTTTLGICRMRYRIHTNCILTTTALTHFRG